jgi:hypothetical protein
MKHTCGGRGRDQERSKQQHVKNIPTLDPSASCRVVGREGGGDSPN